jgi:DNA polymerase III alpha subunit (gram-positive type)
LGKYPQENVARFVGIPFPIKHRAMEDTMVTAQLFSIFTSILKAHDCTTVADLQRRDLTHVLHDKRKTIVDTALAEKQNLWIKYLSPTNAEITDRIITPKECFTDQIGKNRTTYLVAHCHTANAERNFRLDRILDLRIV